MMVISLTMRFSNYNVVKKLGKDVLVYNTLTRSFIKLPIKEWSSLPDDVDRELQTLLHNQGFLLENTENEINKYKYFCYKKAFDNSTMHLTIAPTMQCNFNCSYCFEGTYKTFPVMTKEVQKHLVEFICQKSQTKKINLCWFGGEPLLAFNSIVEISEALDSNNIPYTAHMISNGSLFTKSVVEKLPKLHLTHIQISIDGIGAVHNKNRHYKSGKSSFDDVLRGIDLILSKTDVKLILQVMIDNTHPMAHYQVLDFMKERHLGALEKGQLKIGVNAIKNKTNFDGANNCFSDSQLFEKKVQELQNSSYQLFKPTLPGLSHPCMFRTSTSFAIDSKGYIYRCVEQLGQQDKSIGDLVSGRLSFMKLADSIFDNDAFEDPKCISCNVFPICGGGCPIKRKDERSDQCSFYKDYLAELLPYFYQNQ